MPPYTPIRPITYVVGGGRDKELFSGRKKELEQLKTWLADDLQEAAKPILVTGIGGIG
jgi:hypothetical protein